MKLTFLVLSALFCIGLGLATEPPETEDELHQRTLDEIGHLFHEGLLQLLPHHPRHNLKPLMHLYYLIQVISAYHHSPAHYHTDLDTLVRDLVDEDLQERLRWAIRRLHQFENIRALREHPSIAANPRDKENFVNDIRRLLPAIHQALKAIHLERLHDAGLRTRLRLLLKKCEVLSEEVVHTEYALLALLGAPPVLLRGREEAEQRLLRKPGHGLGLHHHHLHHHQHHHRPGHGGHHHKSPLAEALKQQKKQWHATMNHQRRQVQKILHAKKAFFNKILHDKKSLVDGIMQRQKQFVKELLDKKVDLKTLVDDVVANLNEQRKVFTETMNKNGEVLSELMKDRLESFNAGANQVSGPFTEMMSNVSVEGIVDATKGVVADALHKKQTILKKVFHKPTHHHKHNHKNHHKHHGIIHHQKGIVKQIIDKKTDGPIKLVPRPAQFLEPAEKVSHQTDEMEDRYEYENERYEFKPEYYETQDPEEKPSGRKLDSEEFKTPEELQRLDQEAITEGPEARIIDNDDEVTMDYWTPAPAGKTTTTIRPVYQEDLEAATAHSEPIWLDVRTGDRSDDLENYHVPDQDNQEEPKGKQYKSEIELPALYQVSTRILDLVAMLEDGAGFKGLNENISSNDMALIVNHLAQQELDKMEEDRGITQPELIGGLKWLIEYKEVPEFERMLDLLELWRQAELLQIKVNAKNGKQPEKSYLVTVTDELEDDLGEDDADYDDEDYVEWEEAPVPEAEGDSTLPDDVIRSTEGSSGGGISKDVKRSQPFPEEDPDLTEPLKEKSPVDQGTKRNQPFPEERPDETEPLEMV